MRRVRSSAPRTTPRVQRTRAALLAAFNKLFLEHGYEALTPAQIAAEAGVGRSTFFYEHHPVKEALLRHSVTPFLQPLADAAVGRETPSLTSAVHHCWQNRRLATRLLADRPSRVIRDHLVELTTRAMRTTGASNDIPLSLLATGLAGAQLALLEAWLSGRHACTAEQLGPGSDIEFAGRQDVSVASPRGAVIQNVILTQFRTPSRVFAPPSCGHLFMSALCVDKRPLLGRKWDFAAVFNALRKRRRSTEADVSMS